jgi:hypothetical protein
MIHGEVNDRLTLRILVEMKVWEELSPDAMR